MENKNEIMNGENAFMKLVFSWMGIGLLITGGISFLISRSESLVNIFLGNTFLLIGLVLLEFWLVYKISSAKFMNVKYVSAKKLTFYFILFSSINGIVLTPIFLNYTGVSIAYTFVVTAGMFGTMAIYGFVTKKDLSSMGSFLLMGLVGLIIAGILNMFIQSSVLYWIQTIAGILIFVVYTAYDVQKIKSVYNSNVGNSSSDDLTKISISGALTLYLDFINLFLFLLRILGDDD
jgi:FtsH-binding integral membrane protein